MVGNNQTVRRLKETLKVGDLVRIKHSVEVFDKGDVETYSRDVYRIIRKSKNIYKLEDIADGVEITGLFKDYELRKISGIVENKPDNDKEQEAEVENVRQSQRLNRQLRRENIQSANVVRDKRQRQQNKQYQDYELYNEEEEEND